MPRHTFGYLRGEDGCDTDRERDTDQQGQQMSMTTKKPDQDTSAGASSEEHLYRLLVSAAVTIIDRSGTQVETASIGRAIRTLRNRYHDDMPLIALDDRHTTDPLFAGAAPGWMLSDTQIIELEPGSELTRQPDYKLRYHSFKLSDPQVEGAPKTPCKPDALVAVASKAAESSGQPVKLESRMLGFANPTFNPGDAAKAQADEEATRSVLDALDPSLFASSTILVQPPAPVRTGNSLTVPEATGVEYNVAPGDYQIEGEGVSITATPAEGYAFPEDEEKKVWDYEYQPAGSPPPPPEADEDGQLLSLDEAWDLSSADENEADAAESSEAPSQKGAEAPPRRRLRRTKPLSDSTELILASDATRPWWKSRKVLTAAAGGVLALAVVAGVVVFAGGDSADQVAEEADQSPDWLSTAAAPEPAEQPLTEGHTSTLWGIDADLAEDASWTGAGVAHIDPEDDALVLRSTLSGEETARVELDEPVEWVEEFMAGEDPAVGARTETGFIAITSEGDTQEWEIDEDAQLRTSGSTPMLIDDGEIYALVVGEEDPASVTGNPEYAPAAIDGETLIQYASGSPRVVTLPITDDAEHDAAELILDDPAEGASFQRHLTFGHGLSLTEWDIDGETYLVVHDLHEEASVSAVVPSFDGAESWSVGRGMELATIGGYAFDLEDGSLVAESAEEDFHRAMGPVAVVDAGNGREFILDGYQYTETTRVLGYTGAGTAIVRQPDGSVAAVSEAEGTV